VLESDSLSPNAKDAGMLAIHGGSLIRTGSSFMPKYPTKWLDYRLAAGQDYSVAVCGYSGRVRQLYIGKDPLRRALVRHVQVENNWCEAGDHCMALECALNRAEPQKLLHLLDMNEDETLDAESAQQWGTTSMLESFLKFARKVTESLPEEFRKQKPPIDE